jgi:uncharacterized lipoprotein YmbA
MMIRSTNVRTSVLMVCFAASLVACGKSATARFYMLTPTATAASATPARVTVTVGPVSVPASVDRPQFVVQASPNSVTLDEFNRWASPLADAVAVAVAENLAAQLATARATPLVQSAVEADYRVGIEVQRFESAPGSYALLDAVFTVRRLTDGRTATGRTTARETPGDKTYEALAAAHSRAMSRLAADIAAATRALAAQAPQAPASKR